MAVWKIPVLNVRHRRGGQRLIWDVIMGQIESFSTVRDNKEPPEILFPQFFPTQIIYNNSTGSTRWDFGFEIWVLSFWFERAVLFPFFVKSG